MNIIKKDMTSTYFERIFYFEKDNNWILPNSVYQSPKFTIRELQDMKVSLNKVKSELNGFDLLEWSQHTRNRDIAGYVMPLLRKTVHPELLTQAWCKFYEIISTFPPISQHKDDYLRSLHLCEAPGAFVCALNHYLVLHFPHIEWQWLANTLNPSYEGNILSHMIPDDRLICHTSLNWLFGLDQTGDLQQYHNHCDIVKKTTLTNKVGLVTADGSIDCMKDPGEQERLVEFLHYCETFTALKCLEEGGYFVLKIFTIFEDSTICLLYLLNCCFERVSLFKPCTSKGGNSEVYVICNNFYGLNIDNVPWESLIQPYKNGCFDNRLSMFALDDLPKAYITQILSCCQYFFIEKQIEVIQNNVNYFFHLDDNELNKLHYLKTVVAAYFKKKCSLKPIPKNRKVVSYVNVHIKKRKLSQFDCVPHVFNNSISFSETDLKGSISIMYGLRVEHVHTSRFASIDDVNKLMKYMTNSQSKSSLYCLILEYLKENCFVINVRDFNLTPCYKFQKDLFVTLFSAVRERKNIFLLNVPFHTYFLAGLWSVLATGFDRVYFGLGWMLFYKPLIKSNQVVDICSKIQEAYENIDCSVFPSDIVQLFSSNIFETHLDLVVSVLALYNQFSIPL